MPYTFHSPDNIHSTNDTEKFVRNKNMTYEFFFFFFHFLTSIGIEQLPQYCTDTGYVTPSFGPLFKCSNISVILFQLTLFKRNVKF